MRSVFPYAVTYTFTDQTGNKHNNFFNSTGRYKIGEAIDIFYLPDHPKEVMPRSNMWIYPLYFSICGMLILVLSALHKVVPLWINEENRASKEDLTDYARRSKMAYDRSQNTG